MASSGTSAYALGLNQRGPIADQRGLRVGQEARCRRGAKLPVRRGIQQPARQFGKKWTAWAIFPCARPMNRNLMVFTAPCLVDTVVASIQGNRSAAAIARDIAAAAVSRNNLSIRRGTRCRCSRPALDSFPSQLIGVHVVGSSLTRSVGILTVRRCLSVAHLAENIADRDRAHLAAHLCAGRPEFIEHRHAAGGLYLDFDSCLESPARNSAKRSRVAAWNWRRQHRARFFGGELARGAAVLALAFPHLTKCDFERHE